MAKDLVKLESPLTIPDHLKDVSGREGLENVRREDLKLPRLAIAQSTNDQLKRQSPLYIEGLKQGDLFNTVTGHIYGEAVLTIPLIYSASRIKFKPREQGGGIECRSFNGRDGGELSPTCATCRHSQFTKDAEGKRVAPACTNFMNFPSLLPDHNNQMIAASWKSTALDAASRWLTRIQYSNKPMFAGVYEVKSNPDKNAFGDFFVPTFTFKRWTTAEEYVLAKNEYDLSKGKTIVTDEDIPEPGAEEDHPF